jgi:hypothetical protein
MKPTRDPPRLLDEDAPEHDDGGLRAALRAVRDDLPSAEVQARMARRALPVPDPPPGGAPSGGGAPGGAAPSGARWSTRALALGGGASLLAALLLSLAVGRAPTAAVEATPRAPPILSAIAAPEASTAAPTASVVATGAPSAEPAVPAPLPSGRVPTAASLSASATAAPEGETEIALLQRAQEALGASPARALALTGEHATRFPRGALAQEREMIAISALAGMGRSGEARARAAQFAARYPRSVHLRRLEAIVPPAPAGGNEEPPAP